MQFKACNKKEKNWITFIQGYCIAKYISKCRDLVAATTKSSDRLNRKLIFRFDLSVCQACSKDVDIQSELNQIKHFKYSKNYSVLSQNLYSHFILNRISTLKCCMLENTLHSNVFNTSQLLIYVDTQHRACQLTLISLHLTLNGV